jgi:hypothetical protein
MEESLARWEASFLPSGATANEAVYHDAANLSLVVRPPSGYVVLPESATLSAMLAVAARHVVAVVPVHREVVLDLRVLGPDGRPAEGADVAAVEVAGRDVTVVTETIGPGEIRVRGIPYLPGEPVLAALSWGTVDEDVAPEPVEGIGSPDVKTTIPADASSRWNVVVRLAGPVAHFRDRVESDNDEPYEEALLPVALAGAPSGRLRIRALGWDGRPAGDATISGHALDGRGEVLLEDLAVGDVRLEWKETGRLPATATAFVKADATTEVVVREPVGARLDVLVVDAEGRPLPFARLDLGREWFDVEGDRQRVDAFTDVNGRRTITRVEPGTATVSARWGSRHGRATVALRDGERASVRVVAR